MDAANVLSSIAFSPRHNIQKKVREVHKIRHTKLKDYTFPDVVFIATFGALSHIPKYTPSIIQQARCNLKFPFFDNWQKYCKALQGIDRCLAAYGEFGIDSSFINGCR